VFAALRPKPAFHGASESPGHALWAPIGAWGWEFECLPDFHEFVNSGIIGALDLAGGRRFARLGVRANGSGLVTSWHRQNNPSCECREKRCKLSDLSARKKARRPDNGPLAWPHAQSGNQVQAARAVSWRFHSSMAPALQTLRRCVAIFIDWKWGAREDIETTRRPFAKVSSGFQGCDTGSFRCE